MERNEMPVGFAMALAIKSEAIQKFEELIEEQKQEIIAGIHAVKSRYEMNQYVNSLVANKQTDTKS